MHSKWRRYRNDDNCYFLVCRDYWRSCWRTATLSWSRRWWNWLPRTNTSATAVARPSSIWRLLWHSLWQSTYASWRKILKTCFKVTKSSAVWVMKDVCGGNPRRKIHQRMDRKMIEMCSCALYLILMLAVVLSSTSYTILRFQNCFICTVVIIK